MSADAKFAGVEFYLDFESVGKGSSQLEQTKGRGYMNFVYADYWLISRIVFPEFSD